MRYQAIFVDIDNTILDFDAYVRQTLELGLKHFGLKPYEDWMYETFHEENNKLWRRIEEGTLTFEQLQKIRFNNVFARFGIDFDGPTFEKYFRAQLKECAIPVEGAYELLEALKKTGAILCIASNGPYDQQVHRLEIADMKKYFSYFFVSENMGVSKPDVSFFTKAFDTINRDLKAEGQQNQPQNADCFTGEILPENCAIIGDSMTSDMAGGFHAGMHTIFYSRKGMAPNGEHKPEYWFSDLKEIAAFFKEA